MKSRNASRRELRGNPLLRERIHDPYRQNEKRRQLTRCPDCGVTYRNGRWQWPKTDAQWHGKERCPACRRIKDRYPAGELLLRGAFLEAHKEEIVNLVRRLERLEREAHPMNRIIDVEQRDRALRITTTDIHLPHRFGHAIKDAWSGTLKTHYDLEGYFTRVEWERDA